MEIKELETLILEKVRTEKHCFILEFRRLLENLKSPLIDTLNAVIQYLVKEELISISKHFHQLKLTEKGLHLIENTPVSEKIKFIIENFNNICRFDRLQFLTIMIPFFIIPMFSFLLGVLVGNSKFLGYYPILTISIILVAIGFFLVIYHMAKKEIPDIEKIIDKIQKGLLEQ